MGLEQAHQGLVHDLGGIMQVAHVEPDQGRRPVQRLGDAGHLAQFFLADAFDQPRDLQRQRRRSASESSRVPFEVRITCGMVVAVMVPSSGIETWKSDRSSSRNASNSSSARSISSISSTGGLSRRIAASNGRSSRYFSEKIWASMESDCWR